jgi:hypothetical protein
MDKLRGFLQFPGRSWDLIGKPDLLPAGHNQINKLLCSSQKLKMKQIQAQLDTTDGQQATTGHAETPEIAAPERRDHL